jgi:hypothetical protein
MRIAVCFYGQARTAKFASVNLKRYFGNLLNNIDIFTHTWDIRMDRPLQMLRTTFNEPVKVDNQNIEDYKAAYEHRSFTIEDQMLLRKELESKFNPSEITYPYHSFYHAMQLKKQYERANGFEYDVIIKLRPDIIFPPDRFLEQDINEYLEDTSKIYVCYHDDVFHIGKSSVMDQAANFYIERDSLYTSRGLPFDEFTAYLESKGLSLVQMQDRRFTVLRSELTHLDPNNQYHETCYLNSVLYSELFYHLRCSWKWWYNTRNPNWREDMYAALSKMLHPEDLEIMMKHHFIDV